VGKSYPMRHRPPSSTKLRLCTSRGWLLAKLGNPDVGSADWFRELGYFRLAKFIPVLTHIDWGLSYDKPKETGHGSRKGR
jgi:hypothetical protein